MKRLPPVPRQQIYDLYWYFASERQAIFEKRASGLPGPWTNDPILRTYKFCNTFRAADRVSQYMIQHVCYHTEPCDPADRLFQIVAFRMFSKIETWQAIHNYLGRYPRLTDLASGAFTKALEHAHQQNGTIYTHAFILAPHNAYHQPRKYLNHVELFKHMFLRDDLANALLKAPSLEAIFHLLKRYPMLGNFMSYQIAIDLNYSDLINFSENDFTIAGPGALRGIKKAFEDMGDFTPEEIILLMIERQEEEFAQLGLTFNGLFGRKLHAIDAQGLFCELDKYCRVAVPELASARARIKTKFVAHQHSISYVFPAKWQLNTAGIA